MILCTVDAIGRKRSGSRWACCWKGARTFTCVSRGAREILLQQACLRKRRLVEAYRRSAAILPHLLLRGGVPNLNSAICLSDRNVRSSWVPCYTACVWPHVDGVLHAGLFLDVDGDNEKAWIISSGRQAVTIRSKRQ